MMRNLSISLQHYFKSVSEAITWVLPILFESKSFTRTCVASSVNRYFESLQNFDFFQVLDVGATNLEEIFKISSFEDSGESLNVVVRNIKEACENWTLHFHSGDKTREELQRVLRYYSTNLWDTLGKFMAIPSGSEIISQMERLSEVESSIREAVLIHNDFAIEPKDVDLTTNFEMINKTDVSINCSKSSSNDSFELVDDDFSICSIGDDPTSST